MKLPGCFTIFCFLIATAACAQRSSIIKADDLTGEYFDLLKNKKTSVVANQTSVINNTHLVDSLLHSGIDVRTIFCPEHGFRGTAEAGQKVTNYKDKTTGLPVISLYGKNYKPHAADLVNTDVVLFDLQDVGVRCYTYLSTLHYVMEACAENRIPLIVLDRPNPNGYYVDGPLLNPKYSSFAGLHPVPLVYGMTIGEYAQMINGEKWLKNGVQCDLKVIQCRNYTHDSLYQVTIKPSPNLPNMRSIYLFPSLVLFEGTAISMGRKTDFPFQTFGHPHLLHTDFQYKVPGKKGDVVYHGVDLRKPALDSIIKEGFTLKYLLFAFHNISDTAKFFNLYFYNLSGNATLINQIKEGKTESDIRSTWQKDLERFRQIRKKYLLYPDFTK